jgi:hypothetical protein
MKTIYLIWKNPLCKGIRPEWREITGKEFLSLVRSPEGKKRYFIRLLNTDDSSNDSVIVMETTKIQYLDWKREKNHADYLRNYAKGITLTFYHEMESDEDECYGEELIPDSGCDIEAEYIKAHELEMALAYLTADERHLIEHFYLSDKRGTICAYEALTGIPKSTVNRRKKAVLEKLKKFFES